jgi:hypothetical protein
MGVFSKYVCGCPCIYYLLGMARNNTPYVHFTNENTYEYDDFYKTTASYGTDPPVPEVIYHHSPKDIIIHASTDDDSLAEQNRYVDEFALPPLALVHVDLSDTGSVGSHDSHDSIDIIAPDKDLPEKDEWDIL